MKVKVTHTVSYDDVPDIIHKLVRECKEEIGACQNFKFNIMDLESSQLQVEQIKNRLDLVLSKLDDCVNISIGYVSAGIEKQLPPTPEIEEVQHNEEG